MLDNYHLFWFCLRFNNLASKSTAILTTLRGTAVLWSETDIMLSDTMIICLCVARILVCPVNCLFKYHRTWSTNQINEVSGWYPIFVEMFKPNPKIVILWWRQRNSQGMPQIIWPHPLGTMNICTNSLSRYFSLHWQTKRLTSTEPCC